MLKISLLWTRLGESCEATRRLAWLAMGPNVSYLISRLGFRYIASLLQT